MQTFWRLGVIALSTAVLALAAVQVAGAKSDSSNDPTPANRSLAGEELLVADITVVFDCDPSRVSTIQFSASGPATGPYPGTFTAQGSLRIDPQTPPGPRPGTVEGPVTSLTETFMITSPLGTVTGTKRLSAGAPTASEVGSCQHVTGFDIGPVSAAEGTVIDVWSQPDYTALIHEPGGTFYDHGTASFAISEIDLNGNCSTGTCHYRQAMFDQGFLQSTPTPPDTTSSRPI